jgi:peptidoglycan/xylan/chitin deacetylase (PgdA/CDA1 family)
VRPLVLAYHGLGEVRRAHDPYGMIIAPDRFRQHVASLRSRGYEFVTQAEFARRLRERGGPPRGTVSLTFDDGPEDNATLLPGLLEELEVPATLFVCPALLGEEYQWLAPETGIRLMDQDQLRAAAAHPLIEIGSHTRAHLQLDRASEEEAYGEMALSKRELEELVGGEVVSFAYPECVYSEACPRAASRAGYTSAVTCGARGSWSPYELRRESPTPVDSRLVFELKARGLFHRVRQLPPVRVARWATRRYRYRS